jgi:shikimate 5-dehydrogenase
MNQYEIQQAIEAELERMEGLADALREAGIDQSRAEVDYKVNYAKERLRARSAGNVDGVKVTQDHADDLATVATEDDLHARLLTSNNLMTLKEALHASKTHLEALRTLAASYRTATP